MNTLIWSIFRLGFTEVFLIYVFVFAVIFTFFVRSIKTKKRKDLVFLLSSVALSIAIQGVFTYSFRYTERDSKQFIEMVIENNRLRGRIDWNGNSIEFPIEKGTVEVLDEFYGSWDLIVHSEYQPLYYLSVTKRKRSWIIHSTKTKMSEPVGLGNVASRRA